MIKELLVAIIFAVFTAMGLLLLGRDLSRGADLGVSLTMLIMFGGGAVFAVTRLVRRRREQRGGAEMDVPPGVVLPLRRGPFYIGGAWAVLMGVVGVRFGAQIAPAFPWLMGGVGAVGLLLIVSLALGFRRNLYVFLAPEGLRLGQGVYAVLVRWDNVKAVGVGELSGQPLVLVSVQDPAKLLQDVEGQSQELATQRLSKALKSNQSWYGADLSIMTRQFGLSAPALAAAIGAAARGAGALFDRS